MDKTISTLNRRVPTKRKRLVFAAFLLPLLLIGTTACGGASTDASTTLFSTDSMPSGEYPAAPEPYPQDFAVSEEFKGDMGVGAAVSPEMPMEQSPSVVQEDREIIRTGEVSLESDNVTETFEQVKNVFDKNSGVIIDSSLQSFYEQTQEGRVTGKIAPEKLDTVMAEIAGLATVVSQSSTARDVTLESKDLDAQIKAAETSVSRLETLLEQSGNLDNLLRIEVELSQRQAILDSLRNQKTYLANQVAMSTLTVYIRSLAPEIVEPVKSSPGFTAGLERGWEEFKADASRWATDLGQSTPYLLFFGVPFLLALFIVYVIIRKTTRKKPTLQETSTPAAPVVQDVKQD